MPGTCAEDKAGGSCPGPAGHKGQDEALRSPCRSLRPGPRCSSAKLTQHQSLGSNPERRVDPAFIQTGPVTQRPPQAGWGHERPGHRHLGVRRLGKAALQPPRGAQAPAGAISSKGALRAQTPWTTAGLQAAHSGEWLFLVTLLGAAGGCNAAAGAGAHLQLLVCLGRATSRTLRRLKQ